MKTDKKILEIACFERTSAETALQSVADRIEFCADFFSGGLTPNIDEFRYLKSKYNKPIHVMIRPSSGSFLYSDEEFLKMQNDVVEFGKADADGFVFGILEEHGEIDLQKNKILLDLAFGKPCIFHRAIDRTPNIYKSIEKLIDLGFSECLTSGGKNSAMEGKETLKKLIEDFGEHIKILIGGGVRSNNIAELEEITNGKRFHSSAILSYEQFANPEEIKRMRENM